MKIFLLLILILFFSVPLVAQINARLFQFPDVSKTQITFVYAGDIWVVSKQGGTAQRLSSPQGNESFPKFSPEGKTIAFTGNYNGNNDIFTIPVTGGIPERVTNHPSSERMLAWYSATAIIYFLHPRVKAEGNGLDSYIKYQKRGDYLKNCPCRTAR